MSCLLFQILYSVLFMTPRFFFFVVLFMVFVVLFQLPCPNCVWVFLVFLCSVMYLDLCLPLFLVNYYVHGLCAVSLSMSWIVSGVDVLNIFLSAYAVDPASSLCFSQHFTKPLLTFPNMLKMEVVQKNNSKVVYLTR